MKSISGRSGMRLWLLTFALGFLLAGCGGGGGRDTILGANVVSPIPPTVTLVVPADKTVGVPIDTKTVTATFSEAVGPLTGSASFTLTCAAPCISPPNSVTLDATNRVATFALPANATLATLTTYTATITAAQSLFSGLRMASPYVWTFVTGGPLDKVRPTVILTVPATTSPGPTPAAPSNAAIAAVFSKDMLPASLNTTTFTVKCAGACAMPSGIVTYNVASRTAFYAPAASLTIGTTYTATITIAATDLSGNGLAGNQPPPLPAASNYVWTFVAGAPAPAGAITVMSTTPANGSSTICTNATINATFAVPSGLRMDPATVGAAQFIVAGPAPGMVPVVASSITLDAATGRIATFKPMASLAVGVTYTATIKGGVAGVKDLAIPANSMVADYTWTFATIACLTPGAINLGSAATYGIMATAATSSTGPTQINGDVALNPGTSQGIPPAQVNGVIHVRDTAAVQAQSDLLKAYNEAKALPPGAAAPYALGGGANLAGLILPPGTYTSASTVLITGPGVVTLDGGGDANAVWVFQIGSSLTTSGGGGVLLINGAQAKNVFWVPTADGTIGTSSNFAGTILAGRDVTGLTGATINGRILAGAITAGTIALDSNTVNVPAP